MNAHYKDILAEIQDRLLRLVLFSNTTRKKVMKNGELSLQKLGILDSDVELLKKEIDRWKMICHK
jgi:cob(I)alamin adenosyltransferase